MMNKQKFLRFMADEIERQQKDMYKTGEGKKVVSVLIQVYTLVSDGKFDENNRRGDVSDEIRRVNEQHGNLKQGIVHHAGCKDFNMEV